MEVGSLLEDSYINCPPCAEMYKTGERIAFKAAKKNSFINPGAVLEPGSIITCPVDYVADQEGSFYNFSDIVVKRPFRK